MTQFESFTGLPTDIDDGPVRGWAARIVRVVLAILVIGVILAAILWPTVSADAGALTLCIALAACTGFMVIRQALLAERR